MLAGSTPHTDRSGRRRSSRPRRAPKPVDGVLVLYNQNEKFSARKKDQLIVKLKLPPNKSLVKTRTRSLLSSTESQSEISSHLKDRPFSLFPEPLPWGLRNQDVEFEPAIPEEQRIKRKVRDKLPKVLNKRRKRTGRRRAGNTKQKRESDYERIRVEKERVKEAKRARGIIFSSSSGDGNDPAIQTAIASREVEGEIEV